jgi:hypothetical protein
MYRSRSIQLDYHTGLMIIKKEETEALMTEEMPVIKLSFSDLYLSDKREKFLFSFL